MTNRYTKTIRKRQEVKNPYNPQNPLYRALTKLFSGPITSVRHQQIRKLKSRDYNKYSMTSASGKEFKRLDADIESIFSKNFMFYQNRADRYIDFDQMEFIPEIKSALDIYAGEMTPATDIRPVLGIHCPNEEIKTALRILFYDVLNAEQNLFHWARTACKYGDFYLYLHIDEEKGITSTVALPLNEIERLEGQDEYNPDYIQFQWNTRGVTFESWQVAHFRFLGNDMFAPYGTSVLNGVRRTFRQLILLEDAMMAYRVTRSAEKKVFYVDIAGIPPDSVEAYMKQFMNTIKANQIVDSETGKVDLRYNPLSVEQDYYIATRGRDSNTRIETLPGGQYTGDIDDVKYIKEKMLSGLLIPSSYLNYGEGATEEKGSLSQKDLQFARTIRRLQQNFVAELYKIAQVHLWTIGFRTPKDLASFELSLNNPSRIAELQEIEYLKSQLEAAGAAEEYFSKRYIYENILKISYEEQVRNQREIHTDRKMKSAQEGASGEGPTELESALGAGTGGFDDLLAAPGAEQLGNLDTGSSEGDVDITPPEAEDTPVKGDDVLLSTPGKRSDGSFEGKDSKGKFSITPRSKGKKHYKKPVDGREQTMIKKMNGAASREKGTSTARNLNINKDLFRESLNTNYSNNLKVADNFLRQLKERFEGDDDETQ